MGKITLEVCCNLENLKQIEIPADAEWYFKTKCNTCQEESGIIFFNLVDKVEMEGSRGTANYIAKCKGCKRPGSIDYCKNSLRPYEFYYIDNKVEYKNEEWQPIATFECRGAELIEFFPGTSFSGRGLKDTPFGTAGGEEPLDLQEGDWAGYDEDADESVGVYEFKSRLN